MRKVITASEGHILTNGEIYGREIYLADGMDKTAFYEITNEEYNALMQQEEENYSNGGDTADMR